MITFEENLVRKSMMCNITLDNFKHTFIAPGET